MDKKLKDIQTEFLSRRNELATAELELQKSRAELAGKRLFEKNELKGLNKDKYKEKVNEFKSQQETLEDEIKIKSDIVDGLNSNLKDLSNRYFAKLDPIKEVEQLNNQTPILLFPLRLETRFKKAESQNQLWLRVYPDDCNLDKKEGLLSKQEMDSAYFYWIEMAKAAGIVDEQRYVWRSIVSSYGSGRSKFIIDKYKPDDENFKPKSDSSFRVLVINGIPFKNSNEETSVSKYWISFWLAGNDAAKKNTAFEKLKTDLSLNDDEAKTLVKKYEPVNIKDKTDSGLTEDKIIVSRIKLPDKESFIITQGSWNKAPKAVLLPDRFIAIAFSSNNKEIHPFENPVRDYLPVGIDPNLTADKQIRKDEDKELLLNEDLKWIADFDEAVKVGMATKINLNSTIAASGFDKLFVVGLRFSENEETGSKKLKELFDHHFESKDGFGLLKQGTPTNNTETDTAGYSWTDDADKSFDTFFLHDDKVIEGSDGQKLAEILNMPKDSFAKVPNGNNTDQIEIAAMNTALWPATMGYFMEEMMDPLFSDEDLTNTREFFINNISGRGFVPPIRIGKQPYGILPVSVFSRLNFTDESSAGLEKNHFYQKIYNYVNKIDKVWDSLINNVSFVGKDADPHQVLIDVLGLHPDSVEFHQRFSQTATQLYNQLIVRPGSEAANYVYSYIINRGKLILNELGIDDTNLKLPVLENFFLSNPNKLSGPLVDIGPTSEEKSIQAYKISGFTNYIDWLAKAGASIIQSEKYGENGAPNALLYLLLRHALMLAQANAATKLLVKNKIVNSKKEYFDQPHYFIQNKNQDKGKSKFEHLNNIYPEVSNGQNITLNKVIYTQAVLQNDTATLELNETLNALKQLVNLPTARLERLMTEHIDCCNYRIDAWKTGLISQKLKNQREAEGNKGGIYLGAYGWLLNVLPRSVSHPDFQLSPLQENIFNPKHNKTVVKDQNNLGFIHAPSLDQAATAAILRNAYVANKNTTGVNPFAVNLTSERVRLASNFLEGLRNGQSLAALLGYQFEKGLHDKHNLGLGEADEFILPIRKAFPLVADNLNSTETSTSTSIESIEANNVIDGLKLIQFVKNSVVKTYPFGGGIGTQQNLPNATDAISNAINTEVNHLMEIHDAISDIVIAEQMYQTVKGNFEKANGVAEAFSKGSYPPDIDVIKTPRTGIALTHRMAVHFNADASDSSSPNSLIEMTVRSKAEPSINEWMSSLLPSPDKVKCKVKFKTPAADWTTVFISQKELGLQPIDLLYSANVSSDQAMTELDDRILNHVRFTISNHPYTEIKIEYASAIDNADKSQFSFFEIGSLLKSIRKILIGNKQLHPDSFGLPTGETIGTVSDEENLTHLKKRIIDLKEGLQTVQTNIETKSDDLVSLTSCKTKLKSILEPYIIDATTVNAFVDQLETDLKFYVTNTTSANKAAIIAAFETKVTPLIPLSPFVPADIIDILKTNYENITDKYLKSFKDFDQTITDTIKLFMKAAMFDNNQTGTGFIHRGIADIYSSIFEKLKVFLDRWKKKKEDFENGIHGYNPGGNSADQFDLLKKLERMISTNTDLEPEITLPEFYSKIDNKKNTKFDSVNEELKSIEKSNKNKVIDFLYDTDDILAKLNDHDLIKWDELNSRNDTYKQKLDLILLLEDVALNLKNEAQYLKKKIAEADALILETETNISRQEKVILLLKTGKKLLNEEALLLARFNLDNEKSTEIENTFKNSDSLLKFVKEEESRLFPVDDWLAGVARVRTKAHDFENIASLAGSVNPSNFVDLTPLQFPYNPDDHWLAMKFRKDTQTETDSSLKGDKLLYTAHFAKKEFDKAKSICGIVFDEWTEVIPGKEETTGLSFHFDQPNSEPPQTMLLLVSPGNSNNWLWNDIIDTLTETLEMSKKRAIEPAMIETTDYAQFLPSTMISVTSKPITVSTNIASNNNKLVNKNKL